MASNRPLLLSQLRLKFLQFDLVLPQESPLIQIFVDSCFIFDFLRPGSKLERLM